MTGSDRLRPALIARMVGSVATHAATVEERASRVAHAQRTGGNVGASLLSVEDAVNALELAFSSLCGLAADETIAHPLGARAHAAEEAVHSASRYYGEGILARMLAWRTKARPAGEPESEPEACPGCEKDRPIGSAGLCSFCEARLAL